MKRTKTIQGIRVTGKMVRGQKKAPSYISEKQKHTQKDGKRETATLTLQMKQANAEFCHQHKFHLFSMSV